MNTKVLLAALAGGIFYFLFGWLVYGTLLADSMVPPECIVKPFVMWSMAVSCLIWGLFIAVICSKWANARTFGSGATVGAIVGFLVSLSHHLALFSMYNMISLTDTFMGSAIELVASAIVGGIAGAILGMGSKPAV